MFMISSLLAVTSRHVSHLTRLALIAAAGLSCAENPGSPTGPVENATATLRIEITGLAPGVAANVAIERSGGPATPVTASRDVRLTPGTYTVATKTTGGIPHYPVVPTQTVSLTDSQVVVVRARYAPFPVSGEAIPALVTYDDSIIAFMRARSISAGVFAVSRGGAVVFSRAYGWKNQAKTVALPPDSPMRIASLTKAVTMAAIRQLVAEGKLSYSTPAFAYLGLSARPAGATVDSRLSSITVQMLLDHKAGFGPAGSVPDSRAISIALGLSRPPTPAEVVEWVMGRPLMYDPGATYAYSNVGFAVLGLMIEKASGQDYLTYVSENQFPVGHTPDLRLSRNLVAERDSREPRYVDPHLACSVYVMTGCSLLPTPDGGLFNMDGLFAYGGLVTTPSTYLAFMTKHWGNGAVRVEGQSQTWAWNGGISGTFTIARWRPDGTTFVAFFNQRHDSSGLSYESIGGTLNSVTSGITEWP